MAVRRWVFRLSADPDHLFRRFIPSLQAKLLQLRLKVAGERIDEGVGSSHRYGMRNSICVDVFDRFRKDSVCVYDVKTGRTRFTAVRMDEIANNVTKVFSGIDSIFVIEARTDD